VAGRKAGYIDARSLPTWIRAAASRRRLSRLEQLEAGAITMALAQADGNKLEAAKSLGIARSTLYRRMRAMGLELGGVSY
jgi:transcriptional regulator of acetoin/glycerol metabolism